MDVQILKTVLRSADSLKDLEKLGVMSSLEKDNAFPPLESTVVNTLADSFTNILLAKVSQQMYQRYAIQTHIITQLQEWVQTNGTFNLLQVFIDGAKTLNFAIRILKKFFTQDRLQDASSETLEYLARLLLSLDSENFHLHDELNRVIILIAKMTPNETTNMFLESVISRPELEKNTIENIYITRKMHFIEKPIFDSFSTFTVKTSTEFKFETQAMKLFEKMTLFPSIFRLVSFLLKDIFVMSDYSDVVVEFTQLFLRQVALQCSNAGINLIDLYPQNLQPCVILMRIEPRLHTTQLKKGIFEVAKDVFIKDSEDLLILVLHFPELLESISEFLAEPELSSSFSV